MKRIVAIVVLTALTVVLLHPLLGGWAFGLGAVAALLVIATLEQARRHSDEDEGP